MARRLIPTGATGSPSTATWRTAAAASALLEEGILRTGGEIDLDALRRLLRQGRSSGPGGAGPHHPRQLISDWTPEECLAGPRRQNHADCRAGLQNPSREGAADQEPHPDGTWGNPHRGTPKGDEMQPILIMEKDSCRMNGPAQSGPFGSRVQVA